MNAFACPNRPLHLVTATESSDNQFPRAALTGFADLQPIARRHSNRFLPEEQALLAETVRKSYLTTERRTITATVAAVARAFTDANARRLMEGMAPLRIPGKTAVRGYIKRLGIRPVMIARGMHIPGITDGWHETRGIVLECSRCQR